MTTNKRAKELEERETLKNEDLFDPERSIRNLNYLRLARIIGLVNEHSYLNLRCVDYL
jgi:hypothetical protein